MKSTVKALLTLCLTLLMLTALTLPAAADAIAVGGSSADVADSSMWVIAGILVAAVILATVFLIRILFGKDRGGK